MFFIGIGWLGLFRWDLDEFLKISNYKLNISYNYMCYNYLSYFSIL